LGRHYAYVQYQNNPSQGTTVWRVMAAQNLVDHSTQPSFYIEHSITPRVSLFSLGTAGIGPRKSEFGAFYRYSLMAGAKVFLF